MKVAILQTSDGESKYTDLMKITGEINELYCKHYNYDYIPHYGVTRGFAPWHSVFNRLFLLPDMIKEGKYDWIIYLDADAYMCDFDRSLEDIISEYTDKAMIAAGQGPHDAVDKASINAGVLIINARHELSLKLFETCRDKFMSVPDDVLKTKIEPWSPGLVSDQALIIHELRQSNTMESVKRFTGDEIELINYGYSEDSYISQCLGKRPKKRKKSDIEPHGDHLTSIESRIEWVKKRRIQVFNRAGIDHDYT